jgi:hypothetical protein
MRISLVVGYASLLLVQDITIEMGDVPAESRTASVGFFFFVLALTALVYLWLIQSVKDGRNWARMVMLILTVLGIGSMLLGSDEAPPLMRAFSFVDTVIDVTAMVLIFRAPGAAWFERKSPQSPGG